LYPCALRAQSTNASITGRVTDPSKATVPDAKVAAVNLGTNFRYETATNGAGEYTLANLPPGAYRFEVEKTGFKKLIRPDVILHVQDALAIDFEMAVGSVSDSITVQAGAPLVNTTSATVSTVVDQTMPSLGDLPDASNGLTRRYFANLDGTQLVCGKASAGAQSAHSPTRMPESLQARSCRATLTR